jgi:hypothetical protein
MYVMDGCGVNLIGIALLFLRRACQGKRAGKRLIWIGKSLIGQSGYRITRVTACAEYQDTRIRISSVCAQILISQLIEALADRLYKQHIQSVICVWVARGS